MLVAHAVNIGRYKGQSHIQGGTSSEMQRIDSGSSMSISAAKIEYQPERQDQPNYIIQREYVSSRLITMVVCGLIKIMRRQAIGNPNANHFPWVGRLMGGGLG